MGVHANSNLTFDGDASDITGSVSASGEHDCDDPCPNLVYPATTSADAGVAEVDIPEVNAEDYRVWADFILREDAIGQGEVVTVSTGDVCTVTGKATCNNWTYAAGTWLLNSSTVPAGTYYVEANEDGSGGHVNISGSPGSAQDPAMLSIIAEGSIDISGSPKLVPDTPELLFVTDEDLQIAGNFDLVGASVQVEGQMLAKGQIDIGGDATLDGQLIVQDEDVGDLVDSNNIHGSVSITYSGTLGTGTYRVASWRDVRDAN